MSTYVVHETARSGEGQHRGLKTQPGPEFICSVPSLALCVRWTQPFP